MVVCKQALFNRKKKIDLSHNLRIWQLYLDLEMNLGTKEMVKQAFKKCIDLKVASPFMMIAYAKFLEANSFFEESFKVFETALTMFNWPTLQDIWILYLDQFIKR